jgi:hypothetical protein
MVKVMPEPESNTRAMIPPPHTSQHNEATTPERVRQVELNRLRGRYSSTLFLFPPPQPYPCYSLFLVPFVDAQYIASCSATPLSHSQGKTTRRRRTAGFFFLFLLAAQSQQQKTQTPRRRPRVFQFPDSPDEQQQQWRRCGKRKTTTRFASREVL